MIFLHQSGGNSPLSNISLNRLFKNGNISFCMLLNISMQMPSGPGDLFECIFLMLKMISSVVIGLSRSVTSFSCVIFCSRSSCSVVTSSFNKVLK